jgi:NACHT domain
MRVERQLFLNLIRPDPKHNTSIEDQVSSDVSPRTCEWINSDSEFLSWRHSPEPGVLFVVAGPGRGKSVLAKYIVQELRKGSGARRNTVLEFRCGQSSGSSSTVAILKSFLFHLVNTQPSLFRYVKPWFGASGDVGNVETFENLWPTFINVLRDPDVGMVHCVVDGFDECTTASHLLFAIRSLESNKTLSGRFLITSRPSALPIDIDFPLLEIAEQNTRTDVQLYVEHRIQNLPRSVEDSKQLQDLKILVVENAESSFLWAKLAMNEVENLAAVYRQDQWGNNPSLLVGVESVLRSTFREAEAFYRESLQRVAPDHRELVKDLLHTANSTIIPLDSFSFAQAVGIGLIVGDERQAMSTHVRLLVKRYCSPFLTIDEDDDRVRFSHQSAREFLSSEALSKSDLSFFYQDQATASLFMARKCLAWLMKELGSEASEGIDEERAGTHMDTNAQTDMDAKYLSSWENSFLSYAGWHWNHHTFQCQDRISALEDVLFPFLLSVSAWNMWAAFLYRDLGNRDIGEGRETLFSPGMPLLHVLARSNLARVIDHLLSTAKSNGSDPSEIAKRVLQKIPDLDVNRKDSFGHSAL